MASGADWRNLQQKHTNATSKANNKSDMQSPNKDKKYENLQSRILSFEDPNVRPGLYSPEKADKIAFGSQADWSTQAATSKIINKGSKQDTYAKKKE